MGYSAYAYAMDRLPVAIVSAVYPYANATIRGKKSNALFYREPLRAARDCSPWRSFFAGVAIVKEVF